MVPYVIPPLTADSWFSAQVKRFVSGVRKKDICIRKIYGYGKLASDIPLGRRNEQGIPFSLFSSREPLTGSALGYASWHGNSIGRHYEIEIGIF